MPAGDIRRVGRASQGVRTMRVEEGATVVALAPVIIQMEEDEDVESRAEASRAYCDDVGLRMNIGLGSRSVVASGCRVRRGRDAASPPAADDGLVLAGRLRDRAGALLFEDVSLRRVLAPLPRVLGGTCALAAA